MYSDHQGRSAPSRLRSPSRFPVAAIPPLLVVIAVLGFTVPIAAHSLINGRVASATNLTAAESHIDNSAAPKAPVQVELSPPPPMRYLPGLSEPLVATGPVTEQENTDLDAALDTFHSAPAKAGKSADFSDYTQPLQAFIAAHPNSNWNAALNLNLGLGYYHAAYYSRAFPYYEQAWKLGRNADSVPAKRMTDRAVGELADMHARLGQAKELEALFADIGKRPISGMAVHLMEGAREGLGAFYGNPGIAYLCGPAALKNLMVVQKASTKQIKVAEDARSGPHGFSLEQLAALADKAKLKYKLIHREPGQPVPMPSVINWNVHHYAAITGTRDGKYLLRDPTFVDGAGVVTAKAIDTEASGYFLVPASVVAANPTAGWRMVGLHSAEAKAVYGMGNTFNVPPGACSNCDPATGDQGGDQPGGMTIAKARIMSVSLNLNDTPVGYKPQKGLPAQVTLARFIREGAESGLWGDEITPNIMAWG